MLDHDEIGQAALAITGGFGGAINDAASDASDVGTKSAADARAARGTYAIEHNEFFIFFSMARSIRSLAVSIVGRSLRRAIRTYCCSTRRQTGSAALLA